jgi:pimeloyl-ACP methyl ester carboxylesterase
VHANVHYFDETLKSREEHREYAAPLRTLEGRRAFFRMLDETLDVRAMRTFERDLRAVGTFPVPLQLLYAEKDPMVPPRIGGRLHALLPDARFVRVPNASHFMHVDAVEAFAAHALAFLTEAA